MQHAYLFNIYSLNLKINVEAGIPCVHFYFAALQTDVKHALVWCQIILVIFNDDK